MPPKEVESTGVQAVTSRKAGEIDGGNAFGARKVPYTDRDIRERSGEVEWFNWTNIDRCQINGVKYVVPVYKTVKTPGAVKALLEELARERASSDYMRPDGADVAVAKGTLEPLLPPSK
jgi:hypothetical protein